MRPYKCRKCSGTKFLIQGKNKKTGSPHRRCAVCRPKYVTAWKSRNHSHMLQVERRRKQGKGKQIRAYNAAYGAIHPEVAYKYAQRRRKLIREGDLTTKQVKEIVTRDGSCCIYCGKKVKTIPYASNLKGFDHLIPFLRDGKHTATNIAVCCLSCNEVKNIRTFYEYITEHELPWEWFENIPKEAWIKDAPHIRPKNP